MKRYYLGIYILLLMVLCSCEDTLEQLPKATATDEAVFGSENGLALYTNSFYTILPTAREIFSGDEISDYGVRTSIPEFFRAGAFGPRQSSGWDWEELRNINYFLENNVHENVSEDVKLEYNALARFFRAWFYFEKVKRFGDVPWIGRTFTVDDEDLYNGRDSRELVMDSVLADLNFACDNLSTTDDDTRSLITRYVAFAFKSRVCLFEGTYRKYHSELNLAGTADQWLQEAANAARVVMEESGFSLNQANGLDQSYRQLFINQSPVASEVMLSIICDPALSVYNDANWWYTSSTYGVRLSLSKTFVNTYLKQDGTPFTSQDDYNQVIFSEEVKNRDARLGQTIRMQDYQRINAGDAEAAPPVFSYTYTGYQPIKWTLDDMYYDGGNRNINSVSVIRYAEVLLNYAEAQAELGMLSDADWAATIGALRARAGITQGTSAKPVAVDPYLQSTYFPGISDPTLLEIRRERGVELVLEGFRFDDLRRWKRGELIELPWDGMYVPSLDQPLDLNEDGADDVSFYQSTPDSRQDGVTYLDVSETTSGVTNPQQLSNGNSGNIIWLGNVQRQWEDKFYLYPIPQQDIQINANLEQNPGW